MRPDPRHLIDLCPPENVSGELSRVGSDPHGLSSVRKPAAGRKLLDTVHFEPMTA
jgi:hypothetical protein